MIYQPDEDSFLLASELKKLVKGKSVLDLGTGSGIQVKTALDAGASSVLAADINKEAVAHVSSSGIPAIYSNLFSNIKGSFDIIAFNPPYLPEDKREDKESQLATTGGKHGDEIILKFLKQAPKHLNPGGIILLVLSSLTPRDKIEILLKKQKAVFKELAEKSVFMEKLFVLEVKY